MHSRQAKYDAINALDPSEVIKGHNGQEDYDKVQRATILIHRRIPPVRLGAKKTHPIEQLILDQYWNYYYLLSCFLGDGIRTLVERVRTFRHKKNYELQDGWGVALERLRSRGVQSIKNEIQ